MHHHLTIALVLFLAVTCASAMAADWKAAWSEVEAAKAKGLPKTAVEKLQPILERALAEKDHAQAALALCEKITLEANIQGNKAEEKVTRLEEAIKTLPAEMQPLLQAVLARWYWHYFQQNNWRFLNRTATQGIDDKDFTTWDLPRLFGHIGSLYDGALKEEAALQATPIDRLGKFLTPGNQPDELRPTLWDFLVFQAIEFYSSGEQAGAAPEDAFEIAADSPALGTADEFLAWAPATTDTSSPKAKALGLFQKVMAWHKAKGNPLALLDADLHRLVWAKANAVGEGAGERFVDRLLELAKAHAADPLSATARFLAAQDLLSRQQRAQAHALASEGASRFPQSIGGINCRTLIDQIEQKQLTVKTERVAGQSAAELIVEYTNIGEVHFRLVERDVKSVFRKNRYNPNYPEDADLEAALAASPAKEWRLDLPPTKEFAPQTFRTTLPRVKPGFYFLIASWRKDFSRTGNAVRNTPVWVTSLGLMTRSRWGKIEGLVVDNETGEPVAGAAVEAQQYHYDRGWRIAGTATTDQNGGFQLTATEDSVFLVARHHGETLVDASALYANQPWTQPVETSVVFFTDRGLYRPGQTVQFKGILVRVDRDMDTYEVVPERDLEVSFRDPNDQEIARTAVRTNAFGSFSGTFTAPPDRLTGQMRLVAVGADGSTAFQVEEYKRPKFKVSLETPAEGGKLGEPVTVKGEAMSYTGAAIDGARVTWRVVREVRFPPWCWWSFRYAETSREIAHGRATTDKNGKFEVTFPARPDLSIPEKDQPVFTYTVTANVTDTAGETRSQTRPVRVGYTALDLSLSAPAWMQAGQPIAIPLTTATLDGKGIPAAGTVLVHALKAPPQVVRPRLDNRPDADDPDLSRPAAWEEGEVVAEESFQTSVDGTTTLKFTLPAGAYRLVATSRDRFNKPVTSKLDLTVVDPAATALGIKVPFLVQAQNPVVEPGETFRALWGTGYGEGRAFIEVEHRHRIVKSFWTAAGTTQYLLEVPVDESMRGGFVVRVRQMRENRAFQQTLRVAVPWSNKRLQMSFGHFTSKMAPGQKETWTLTLSGPDAGKKAIEVAAGLYDASLDAFAPFQWMRGFGFFREEYDDANAQTANHLVTCQSFWDDWYHGGGFATRGYPQLPPNVLINFGGYEFARYKSAGLRANFADMEGAMPPSPPMVQPSLSMAVPSADMPQEAPSTGEAAKAENRDAGGAGPVPQTTTAPAPGPDLDKVSARTNLQETAFFFPHLAVDEKGTVTMTFTMPEALTTWKFQAFAHGPHCQSGGLGGETVTQKDLMVQPNPPRFLREGDELVFSAKVTNLSDRALKGKVRLSLRDPATDRARDVEFGLTAPDQEFEVPAKESRPFGWRLKVPDGPGLVAYKVVGATDQLSDGEEAIVPVLARRIFVTESVPLPIRGPASKTFKLQKLLDSGTSDTLTTQALTVQMTSNPAWYAVQALPYLMEFPHECSEQTFNRLYANSLARFIAASDPRLRKIFDAWKAEEQQGGTALKSNLEKNEQLKSVLLLETPWVRQAKSETEAKHNLGVLFDGNRLDAELGKARDKLARMQFGDGSWPWFPGGRGDSFITLYIVTGFGRLRHLGVDVETDLAVRALGHLDSWINTTYREILRWGNANENHLSSTIALYLYGRSFFLKDRPIPGTAKEAVDYFLGQAKKYWLQLDCRLSQGHLALGLSRFGDAATAKAIYASLKERSVTDEELGRFWRDTELSWWWYRAPIETQALMIEVFDEIGQDAAGVEDCKVWLLKQKQTQDWKTTKATADAVYALLLKGANLLASDKLVAVSLGGVEVKPEKVEAGTGFYEKRYEGAAVKPVMGEVKVTKEDAGVAWGGLHWQYLEDMSKVTPHETNLKLKKTLFVKADSAKGPVLTPLVGKAAVGDLVTVRIELRTDRDMEYVHMKDQRASGMEPVDVLSTYRYQDGLAYYQSTKDTASHFFIDYLPKGTYVFEYDLRVQHKGRYQTGMTEIQCMYAPEFNSHSESFLVEVE